MKKKVFIDSDVVISSLISQTGAAYFILHETDLELVISDESIKELEDVVNRMNLDEKELKTLIKDRFGVIKLGRVKKGDLSSYVLDPGDEHIIAGAKKAKTKYIISYNIKDFKIDKIAEDLRIIVTTPAKFLQYLRSIQ